MLPVHSLLFHSAVLPHSADLNLNITLNTISNVMHIVSSLLNLFRLFFMSFPSFPVAYVLQIVCLYFTLPEDCMSIDAEKKSLSLSLIKQ